MCLREDLELGSRNAERGTNNPRPATYILFMIILLRPAKSGTSTFAKASVDRTADKRYDYKNK